MQAKIEEIDQVGSGRLRPLSQEVLQNGEGIRGVFPIEVIRGVEVNMGEKTTEGGEVGVDEGQGGRLEPLE